MIRHQTDHNSRNHHVEEAAQGQGQAHSQWKVAPRILHLEITLSNPIKGDHVITQAEEAFAGTQMTLHMTSVS